MISLIRPTLHSLSLQAVPADCTNVDVHYVGDENGYRVQYLIIHSLCPLPACLEDAHDDPATHDPPEESTGSPHNDDLPDSHGEDHGEDHGPSDSHIDYNVTDSHTPYSHTLTVKLLQTFTLPLILTLPVTHTLLTHTPSDSHSHANNHNLESPHESLNFLTLDRRPVG